MDGILYEKQDFHGWTEDKAWVTDDGKVEFDDGSVMEFSTADEASDWLWERGYKHKAIFEAYGITTYLNEINFETEEIMFLVEECLEEMMGTDEDIHYGYNDPLQGETGEDSGKYYVFVDC